eukprot:gene8687-10205_t
MNISTISSPTTTTTDTTSDKDQKNNYNKRSNITPAKAKKEKKRKANELDFDKCHRRFIALKVAYIGWHYHGFAAQQCTEETIEGHLFKALHKTCLINDIKTANYTKSGRTDKGVSAFGQVISLYVRTNVTEGLGVIPPVVKLDEQELAKKLKNQKTDELPYVKMLNGVLPPYIRVLGWSPIPFHFNSRFSTLYRTYKYFFNPANLDIALMREAGRSYLGEHDFQNFCKYCHYHRIK